MIVQSSYIQSTVKRVVVWAHAARECLDVFKMNKVAIGLAGSHVFHVTSVRFLAL